MAEITLTFPDGAKRTFPKGITGKALAETISKSLAKKAVAMRVNGRLADLADPIEANAEVKIVTRKPPAGLAGAPLLVARGFDLTGLKEPLKVFEGSAREAIAGFPANVNVAVALSLVPATSCSAESSAGSSMAPMGR